MAIPSNTMFSGMTGMFSPEEQARMKAAAEAQYKAYTENQARIRAEGLAQMKKQRDTLRAYRPAAGVARYYDPDSTNYVNPYYVGPDPSPGKYKRFHWESPGSGIQHVKGSDLASSAKTLIESMFVNEADVSGLSPMMLRSAEMGGGFGYLPYSQAVERGLISDEVQANLAYNENLRKQQAGYKSFFDQEALDHFKAGGIDVANIKSIEDLDAIPASQIGRLYGDIVDVRARRAQAKNQRPKRGITSSPAFGAVLGIAGMFNPAVAAGLGAFARGIDEGGLGALAGAAQGLQIGNLASSGIQIPNWDVFGQLGGQQIIPGVAANTPFEFGTSTLGRIGLQLASKAPEIATAVKQAGDDDDAAQAAAQAAAGAAVAGTGTAGTAAAQFIPVSVVSPKTIGLPAPPPVKQLLENINVGTEYGLPSISRRFNPYADPSNLYEGISEPVFTGRNQPVFTGVNDPNFQVFQEGGPVVDTSFPVKDFLPEHIAEKFMQYETGTKRYSDSSGEGLEVSYGHQEGTGMTPRGTIQIIKQDATRPTAHGLEHYFPRNAQGYFGSPMAG